MKTKSSNGQLWFFQTIYNSSYGVSQTTGQK